MKEKIYKEKDIVSNKILLGNLSGLPDDSFFGFFGIKNKIYKSIPINIHNMFPVILWGHWMYFSEIKLKEISLK